MPSRSYAGESWLLFAREEEGDVLVFTAVVTKEKQEDMVAELKVDADVLKEHSEELGLEMEAAQFKTLLLEALELRSSVDLTVEAEDQDEEVLLSLTYKFSPTISRKGIFQLPIVATNVPQSIVQLLKSVHETPPQSMRTQQQREKVAKRTISAKSSGDASDKPSTSTQERSAVATTSQASTGSAAPATNPMLLKRRHVPTGAMRRKGPRGAKLAKK